MQAKHFSVLICTARPLSGLKRTLEAIRSQKIPENCFGELWIVDNTPLGHTAGDGEQWLGAQDESDDQLPVYWAHEPKRGLLDVASGSVLLFTDDDIVPCEAWISSMLDGFDRGFDAVSGPILLAKELERPWLTPYLRSWFAEKLPGDPQRDCGLVGANMGILKRVADSIGKFDPELGAGALGYEEETVYLFKIRSKGLRIGHAPGAIVTHYFDASRLGCAAMLEDARKRGISRAVARHRYEQHIPAWMNLRLVLVRIIVPLPLAVYSRKKSEGCPGWVLSWVMSYVYLTKMSQLIKGSAG
jgi:hypothetical protein